MNTKMKTFLAVCVVAIVALCVAAVMGYSLYQLFMISRTAFAVVLVISAAFLAVPWAIGVLNKAFPPKA